MDQDRATLLASFTTEELVRELERRRDEMNAAFARIGAGAVGASPAEGKSTARSEAARARWAKLKAEGFSSLRAAAKTKKTAKK
jgi:hypothetical protein